MNGFDVSIQTVEIRFFEYRNRVPLKFGHEVSVNGETVLVEMTIQGEDGRTAVGYGETPVAAAWSWPSETMSQSLRVERMKGFCEALLAAWQKHNCPGDPMEIGQSFLDEKLHNCLEKENSGRPESEKMPYLAALVCNSAFDLAVYDAYGVLHDMPVFSYLNAKYLNHDLSWYYSGPCAKEFCGAYPDEFLVQPDQVPTKLAACHLVGGKDPLEDSDLTGEEPKDDYPVLLRDWIKRDGLFNLKIKLTGNDSQWDYSRIVRVGKIALEMDVQNLTVDFNCTVRDPQYVVAILERLETEYPAIYEKILYVEQPFPYELDRWPIDVHTVSRKKLLLMDESAHDWRFVAKGRALGWNGVALKTCKTLTGALLSLCYAKKYGMAVMVQDLTNPKLAIIPHALLAAHAGTIMGVEVNSMQFCPDASRDEARIHPGLYRRRNGQISLESLGESGFGYRVDEIRSAAQAHMEEAK